jgi:hypothetical protein
MAKAHAKLSASGAKRWMNCPGSIRMSEGIKSESGEHARLGTAAHAVAEHCLRNGIWDSSILIGGWVLSDETIIPARDPAPSLHAGWDFAIDSDMTEAVNVYLDTIRGEIDRLSLGGSFHDVKMNVEHRFDLSWLVPNSFGTNDCSIIAPFTELVVVDYKHGKGVPVEVEENEQGLFYALGAAHDEGWDFERITIIIVQPRCPHADGSVRRWTITVDQLHAFAARLKEAAEETKSPHARLCAGSWCKFCPAAAVCPELRDAAYTAAQVEFDSIDEPVQDMSAISNADTPEDDLADRMKAIPLLDAFIKATETELLRRLKSGINVTGWKLVRKKANRAWKPDVDPATVLTEKGIPREKLFTEPKLKSPAQVEKIGKEAKVLVAALAHKPEGGITVAPASDPREAVDVSAAAAADFDEVADGAED